MKYDITFVKMAAESLFKLADAIESEDFSVAQPAEVAAPTVESPETGAAPEVVVFKCDSCPHETPLEDINSANTAAGATEAITESDRVRCPVCGKGIMTVSVTTEDGEEDDEDEDDAAEDYLVKEATAMNLTPSQMGMVEAVKHHLSGEEDKLLNQILAGRTNILNDLLDNAEKGGHMDHLEDVTKFGFNGVDGAHKDPQVAVKTAGVNVSKVVSALLVATSLALANGHAPAGSVFSIMEDYAKKHPEAQKVLQENIEKVKSLGQKAQTAQTDAYQKQQEAKAQPVQDSVVPSAKAETAPVTPAEDVWRSAAASAIRNASMNPSLLGRYMV